MPRLRRPRIRIINNDEIMASAGNPSTSNEVFTEPSFYRAQYGAAMLEYLRKTPTWRSEKSVNIWNLLCLSRRMIICIEISIYTSSFPNT